MMSIYDMRLIAAELGLSVNYCMGTGHYEYSDKDGVRVATVARGDCSDKEDLIFKLNGPTRAKALSNLAKTDAEYFLNIKQ